VQRRNDGDSIVRLLEGTVGLAEFLGEMGFSNYSELGFEKILLVEGRTEIKVFQLLLRAMRKDHRIVILPLRGDDFPDEAELHEILRISTRVSVIIDSERDQKDGPLRQKRREFLELCEAKNIRAHATELRATENYFPEDVVQKVFKGKFHALGPYEKLKE
jgi:hypothetical protein